MRRVYPGILSKAVGDASTKEYGTAVLTVFRSSEGEEDRMRFLLIEQVRNIIFPLFLIHFYNSILLHNLHTFE